MDKLNFIPYL